MTLKNYQTELTLGHLYKSLAKSVFSGSEQLVPNIFINSGTVDIYSSNSATQPVSKAVMTLGTIDTNVDGMNAFEIVPTYIYVEQNAGTSAEVVISGVSVEDLGAI